MRFPRMTTRRWMVIVATVAFVLTGIKLIPESGPIPLFATGPFAGIAWSGTSHPRKRLSLVRGGTIGAAVTACVLDVYILASAVMSRPMQLDGGYVEPGEVAAIIYLNLLLFTFAGAALGLIVEATIWTAFRVAHALATFLLSDPTRTIPRLPGKPDPPEPK